MCGGVPWGEAREGLTGEVEGHVALVGLGVGEDRVRERTGLLFREAHRASYSVRMTVTPRKREGGHPWLMALICEGCPLPSEFRPTFSHVASSPMPSHDCQ